MSHGLQRRQEGTPFGLHNPPHSEVNQNILNLCASSPTARNKLEEALEETPSGAFRALEYSELIQRFRVTDLVRWFSIPYLFHHSNPNLQGKDIQKHSSAWQSLLLYHEGLTFDSDNPTKNMKIPNMIAARRIATAVLDHYGLTVKDIDRAIDAFAATGDITEPLKLYQYMMGERDVGYGDFDKNEEIHANTFSYSILKNVLLTVKPEFVVTVGTNPKKHS